MTYTITTRIGTYYGEQDDMRIIEAHDENGHLISELYADINTGQIMQVETIEERRGEGIATALVEYADAHDITLYHSPAEHMTPEGAAFAARTDWLDEIAPELAYQP